MKRTLGMLLALMTCFSAARGQDDGSCTFPLTLSADLQAQLADALVDSLSGFGPADHGLAAPLVTAPPVADGVIGTGEYPNTCFYSFVDRENPGNPYAPLDTIEDALGDEDLSLHLHLAHSDEFLFLGFEVTDEFLDLDDGSAAWQNDGIELFLNPDNDLEDVNPDTVGRNWSAEGMQLVADARGDGDLVLNARHSSGVEPTPIEEGVPQAGEFYTAGLPSDTGYVVEFQIPLASLDTDSDDGFDVVPATTGDVMLMNAVVNDNDEPDVTSQDTHAMLWFLDDDQRSPFGGGENIWVVPLQLTQAVGDVTPQLQAGDADQDLDFDQLDLVKVQIAAKYLTGQAATWGEGDWNGAPGGEQGNPPAGDGQFNQIDIIAALAPGHYLTGPYAALAPGGMLGDEQTSLVYDAGTGELSVDSPASKDLTSINITSAGSKFIGDKPAVLDGAFDNFAADNIFKATFGGSFGDISFGNVLPAGISEAEVQADLTAVGSLAGGGDLGNVDLVYIPEPLSIALLGLGVLGVLVSRRRRSVPS